jgi:UDP-3-O-[3-hydroxymyristoyl] N-acetylglucosamine deacetylase
MTMKTSGIGIHSGHPCRVELHHSAGPVRFLRDGVEIPADVDAVASTDRCTTLAHDGARVAMVEHLLSALYVTGWWRDLAIEVSSVEIPILDGSAEPWLKPIDALGEPPNAPDPFVLEHPVAVTRGSSTIRAAPGAASICCEIDFAHPAIGKQQWCGGPADYRELLPARTFGLLTEAEALAKAGLARGAGPDNVVVFGPDGPLEQLRAPDEPVRHKALDLLGDLFLLGRPLRGHVMADRGSHALHVALVRDLHRTTHRRSEVIG